MFHVIAHTDYSWRGMGIVNPSPAIVATCKTERAACKLAARLAGQSCAATTYTVQRAA